MILKNKPKGWREGQTIYNFLYWLKSKGYSDIAQGILLDIFDIPDTKLNKLYKEFLKENL